MSKPKRTEMILPPKPLDGELIAVGPPPPVSEKQITRYAFFSPVIVGSKTLTQIDTSDDVLTDQVLRVPVEGRYVYVNRANIKYWFCW
jgi:hypothetical protein